MQTSLQLERLNRRLRDCAAAVLIILLLSPPAVTGVIRDAPRAPLCREVEMLLGPWPVDGYLTPPGTGPLAVGLTTPAANGLAGDPPGRSVEAVYRDLTRTVASKLHELLEHGRSFARRVEAWLAAPPARPAADRPRQESGGPAGAFHDVLQSGPWGPLWPGPATGLADPGGPDADAVIQPGVGPLHWIRTSMTRPPEQPPGEPVEVETPVLARFADIVLPMTEPSPPPRSAGIAWPALTQDSTEVLLKMIAITFIATVLLVPTACSATARAMHPCPRDGP